MLVTESKIGTPLLKLFTIDHDLPGRLAIMPHPPGGAALAPALDTLRTRGVSVLGSLLTRAEIDTLGLHDEQALFEAHGGTFMWFPVVDRGVPDDRLAFARFVADLRARLDRGEHAVLHCWGGIGRSGLTACAVLVNTGLTPELAMAQVSAARGCDVPETTAQRQFLRAWHAARGAPASGSP